MGWFGDYLRGDFGLRIYFPISPQRRGERKDYGSLDHEGEEGHEGFQGFVS